MLELGGEPASRELEEGGDVDQPPVQVRMDAGHVLPQERPIDVDGVARQVRLVLRRARLLH